MRLICCFSYRAMVDCAESAVFLDVAGWLNTRGDDCKGGFHRAGAMGIVLFAGFVVRDDSIVRVLSDASCDWKWMESVCFGGTAAVGGIRGPVFGVSGLVGGTGGTGLGAGIWSGAGIVIEAGESIAATAAGIEFGAAADGV